MKINTKFPEYCLAVFMKYLIETETQWSSLNHLQTITFNLTEKTYINLYYERKK